MISVVVPAYNEARRLPSTLARMRAWLDVEGGDYELLVVDDGSSDRTAGCCQALQAEWPQLSVLQLTSNRGKGAAVRAGMLRATGDLRLFSDADLSTPMEELPHLRAALSDRCQVAIASRALPETAIEVHQARYRELMGSTYNRLLQTLVLPGIHDSQCGFKLFTALAAQRCFGPLRTMRFGFDAEVLLRARQAGWEIAEIPVRWRHVDASRVNSLRDSTSMLLDLLRLRLGGV